MGLGAALLSSLFVLRLLIDSSFRMVYSFVPQIAAGLDVSISVFGWLLMVRSSSAIFSPVLGSLADRYGRRNLMVFALLAQAFGMFGITLLKGWWVAIPIFFSGVAVNSFLPAQQAYISDMTPFERRGRALATADSAFAISGMLVMPLIGWLIDAFGWRVPFAALALLALFAAVLTWRFLPEGEHPGLREVAVVKMGDLLKKANIRASLVVAALLFTGVGIFMTFWSIWLSADFAFDAVELGLMATRIGIGEALAVFSAALVVDKLGKQRSSLLGVAMAALFFGLIPLWSGKLTSIRIMLVLTVFWLEYSIVSLFPLYGEQAPEARATIFALVALANGVGLALGPVLATSLWAGYGLTAITSVAAVSLGLSALLIFLFLKEKPESEAITQSLQ